MSINSINAVPTYSSFGKLDVGSSPTNQSSFLDLVKQPLANAVHDNRAHETAVLGNMQGQVSTLDLMYATTKAENSVQEALTYISKFTNAVNDITKMGL